MEPNEWQSRMDSNDFMLMSSDFHQNLLSTLSDVGDQLTQILSNSEILCSPSESQDSFRSAVWETQENYHICLGGIHAVVENLEAHTDALDKSLTELQEQKQILAHQRDNLIDRGHELNCRLGYNALERKLDESFTDLERFTNEESAKCFRDEAEENLKRTNDNIRLGNMRSCQLDRDAFHQMEKITNVFESYETDRSPFVQELDLFSDVRRNRISSWLTEATGEDDIGHGERLIDVLNLEQRRRHMEAQVIKNALRMYSFNASLNFDRQDNNKRLDELTNLQVKASQMSGVNRILPRRAVAKTNLVPMDSDRFSEGARGDGLEEDELREDETTGKGLHRSHRKVNLASDPITDPELVSRLDAALRWERNDSVLTWVDQVEGGAEHVDNSFTSGIHQSDQKVQQSEQNDSNPATEQISVAELAEETVDTLQHHHVLYERGASNDMILTVIGSSSSITHGVMGGDSVCGDAQGYQVDPTETGEKVEGSKARSISMECQLQTHSTHSHLSHIESQPVLPGSAEKHIAGLVRRKHSSRQVGSLTNLQDCEGTSGVHHRQSKTGEDSTVEDRDTRSQGSEPASSTRLALGGNRSRECVPGGGGCWDKE